MANYTIDKIKYGNDTYIIKDSSASTTDNKVSLTADSTNEFLPVTFKKGTTSPAGIYYNDNIKVNPSTGTINATAAKFVNLGADKGIFNKLIATTADIDSLDVNNLTATNAKVVGMLDVQGDLHTNSWTNANMANIGGSFYISPTIAPTDGSTTITINRVSATSWTIQLIGTFATDFIKSGTSSTGVNWPANSLVLVTGNVTLNNMVYPLGTLKGTLSSAVTASAASTSKTITITGVVDGQGGNTPYVLQELYELNGNANLITKAFTNGKISLYQLGSFPIGIQLSSMGVDSNSIIDIYGGVKSTPTVRIGHLAGLPAINNETPTGWGIYTDNGYFSGVIVSTAGKIGNWTIEKMPTSSSPTYGGALYTGSFGVDNGIFITPSYTSSTSIGGSSGSKNWTLTASNKFGVTKTGELWANLAHIKGSIDALGFIARDETTSETIATFNSQGINFSDAVDFKIGSSNNYIQFDSSNNTINIIGSGVYFGSTPIGDVATADKIDTAINNIEIGGRNLLLASPENTSSTTRNYGSHQEEKTYTFTGWDNYAYYYLANEEIDFNDHVGEYLTYRAWVSNDSQTVGTGTGIMLHFRFADNTYVQYGGGKNGNVNSYLASGESGWLIITVKIPDPTIRSTPTTIARVEASIRHNSSDGSGTVTVKENKVELGNKPTDWTPAPEDIDNSINAVQNNTSDLIQAANNRIDLTDDKAETAKTAAETADGKADRALNAADDAAKTATNYISSTDSNGITLHDTNQTTTGVHIDSPNGQVSILRNAISQVVVDLDGLSIYSPDGSNRIARYGDTAIIGDENDFHVTINKAELGFYQGSARVAWLNNNQLYIGQSVVLKEMAVGATAEEGGDGRWTWKVHKNINNQNNLGLKWNG